MRSIAVEGEGWMVIAIEINLIMAYFKRKDFVYSEKVKKS